MAPSRKPGGRSVGRDQARSPHSPMEENLPSSPRPPKGRPDRLLRREVPINTARKCARAPAHVRAGPRGNALGFQGECAVVTGHLRARQFAGKTPFLDARSAQRMGCKGLAFSCHTRNSCPTINFDITRFSEMTYNRWPGPLLDAWTGFLGAFRRPGCRPNVVEHTMLAASRKAISGRTASRPACFAGRPSSARRPGALRGGYSAQRTTSVPGRVGCVKRTIFAPDHTSSVGKPVSFSTPDSET